VSSANMRCRTTASLRAKATLALRIPARIANRIAQLFSNDPFTGLVRMTFAASSSIVRTPASPILYQPPHPVTCPAQARLVMDVMRSGNCMKVFQACWQASRIAP